MSFDNRPRQENKMVVFALANAKGKTPRALAQSLAEKFKVAVEFSLVGDAVFFTARGARKIYNPIPVARATFEENASID